MVGKGHVEVGIEVNDLAESNLKSVCDKVFVVHFAYNEMKS